MERQTLAFLIMAVMAVPIVGWAAFRWYHGRARSNRRRRSRERAAYDDIMAAKENPDQS